MRHPVSLIARQEVVELLYIFFAIFEEGGSAVVEVVFQVGREFDLIERKAVEVFLRDVHRRVRTQEADSEEEGGMGF